MTLIFHNPGEIDIRGATIAGLNAKHDSSAIGYFGTGLKYAIAQVLANGGQISIWSGLTRHDFKRNGLDFRGKSFEQVCMYTYSTADDGATDAGTCTPLGFTTEYGKNWLPWQIFRELYANALDEGGSVRQEAGSPRVGPDMTNIVVSGWPDLETQYLYRDEIILPPTKRWNAETPAVQCARAPAGYIYLKGVRIHEAPCKLTWNFLNKANLSITEDRTLRDSWRAFNSMGELLKHHTDEESIRVCLDLINNPAGQKYFERGIFGWISLPKHVDDCSPQFASVATSLYRQSPTRFADLRELALSHCPNLEAAQRVKLTTLQQKMLDRAKALVSKMGFDFEIETIPITVQHLGKEVLGQYKNDHIYLSPIVFDQGTKQVVSTLYEECLHAKTGLQDCCYEMQTHLFNTIVGLWEELWQEPI